MHELIEKIKSQTGINDEQAVQAIETIKAYVKEKFPMLAGAVDNLFAATNEVTDPLH